MTKRRILVILCLCCVGWLDEWHKQFIEGRHYQIGEAVLNMIGGLMGGGMTAVFYHFFL